VSKAEKACVHHCYSTRTPPSGGNLPSCLFVAGHVLCGFGVHGRGKIAGITILSDDATTSAKIDYRNMFALFPIPRTPISMLARAVVEQNGQYTKIGFAFRPNIEMGVRGSKGPTPLPSKSPGIE